MKLICVLALLLLSGCYENNKREEFRLAGCTPISKPIEQTDQPKKYCGKACTQYVRREYFACGAPDKPYLAYFEY